jgi:arylsulfatase
LKARGEIDGLIVDHSTQYLKERGADKKPFLLTVTFTQVHGPLVPHPDFRGRSGAGDFPDILMELDHNVGRILVALEQAGLKDNTIVALSGENGALVELGWGSNGPWRGGLGTGWEGGFRTPAMIRWPGKIADGRVSDEIVAALDWLPTFAHIIEAVERIPTDRPIDGIDQSAFFLGKQEHSNREHILYYIGDQLFAGKWRDFKMHFITREGRIAQNKYWSVPLLYNVKRDPGEYLELNSTDIVGRYIWAAAELLKVLGEKQASMKEYPNIAPGAEFDGYRK